jgi:hypothetical protein
LRRSWGRRTHTLHVNVLCRAAQSHDAHVNAALHAVTNAFSKKFDNHCHALALYFVWYNFVKQHKAHKLSPAMAAGLTDKLWSVEDIAALVDAAERKPGPRGPYKKRAA